MDYKDNYQGGYNPNKGSQDKPGQQDRKPGSNPNNPGKDDKGRQQW